MNYPLPTVTKLNPKMRVERFKAEHQVQIHGGGIPLIDPKGPREQQVQQRLIAKCKVFDLLKPDEIDEYQRVWQSVSDDKCVLAQHEVRASPDGMIWRAYMRWGEKEFLAQGV